MSITVAIIGPIEILVFNGDVLDFSGRFTRGTLVDNSGDIDGIFVENQIEQIKVYFVDLRLHTTTRSLILVHVEKIAEFIDSKTTALDVLYDWASLLGCDAVSKESDFVLEDLVTVADVELFVSEIVRSVCRVLPANN